jgi:hypothetical protein
VKRIVAGLGLTALFVLVTTAVAQTDNWKEYVYTGDGFAIASPVARAAHNPSI